MSGEIEKISGPAGTELVSMGYALIRAENDALQRISVDHPRNPDNALTEALAEFSMLEKHLGAAFVQDYAKKGYYSIPYADDTGEGGKTFVEGLSIRSMERLMRVWGKCSVSGRFMNEDESGYDVSGVAIDFQTGWRLERTLRVSKYGWRRKGGVVLLSTVAQAKAVQIGISKASRNAGLAILPDWLRMIYFKRLKELAAGPLEKPADTKKVGGVLLGFQKMGVTREMLEDKLEKSAADWSGDDLAKLIGLGAAIRDKEANIEDLFDIEPPKADPAVVPPTLVGTTVTGKNDAQRDREKTIAQKVQELGDPAFTPPKPAEPSKAVEEATALFDFDGDE